MPLRPVRAIELKSQELVRLHTFPGRTRAVGRVNLSFRVGGPLIERPVNVGDRVEEGALLARIDPRDFEVELDNAKGRYEQTQAELRFAESDLDRSMRIWEEDPGAISESFLDRKKEDVNRLKGQLKTEEANVDSARDQVDDTYLLSPYDGIIVATYVENYEYVKAKQPIVRLLNNSEIEMIIDVPESLISEIPFVDEIEVEFDALPGQTFPGKIKEIGTEASATTRTYPVTLLIEQPDNALILAGMAGHAILSSHETDEFNQEGFLLPPSALFTDKEEQGDYVWLVDPGTGEVRRQKVVRGKLTKRGVVVSGGLEVGQWVVTSGVYSLSEGQEVRVHPVELNAEGEQVELL